MKYDTALPDMTIAPFNSLFLSVLVFGLLYFSQIPARSKSDTDK